MGQKNIIRLLHIFQKIYWFLFRPHTRGVKGIIVHENKILMIRLSYYPNTWTFPGGGIKRGETPEKALVRECEEEVGLTPQNLRVVGGVSFEHEYKKDMVTVFQCGVSSFDFIIDNREVVEARWFAKDALPVMGSKARKLLSLSDLSF